MAEDEVTLYESVPPTCSVNPSYKPHTGTT